jgi:hypothetical protein
MAAGTVTPKARIGWRLFQVEALEAPHGCSNMLSPFPILL